MRHTQRGLRGITLLTCTAVALSAPVAATAAPAHPVVRADTYAGGSGTTDRSGNSASSDESVPADPGIAPPSFTEPPAPPAPPDVGFPTAPDEEDAHSAEGTPEESAGEPSESSGETAGEEAGSADPHEQEPSDGDSASDGDHSGEDGADATGHADEEGVTGEGSAGEDEEPSASATARHEHGAESESGAAVPPLSPRRHGAGDGTGHIWDGGRPGDPEPTAPERTGPSGSPGEQAVGSHDLYESDTPSPGPSGSTHAATRPAGQILPVLPLGAGMASIGLGLAFLALRLRRR